MDLGKGKRIPLGGKATAEELAQVYDTLLGHGFRKEHVQQALQVSLILNILVTYRSLPFKGSLAFPVSGPAKKTIQACPARK